MERALLCESDGLLALLPLPDGARRHIEDSGTFSLRDPKSLALVSEPLCEWAVSGEFWHSGQWRGKFMLFGDNVDSEITAHPLAPHVNNLTRANLSIGPV